MPSNRHDIIFNLSNSIANLNVLNARSVLSDIFGSETSVLALQAGELTVSTDKDDYGPGETAIFTIDGVDEGGAIRIEVDHIAGPGEDGEYGTLDDEVVDLGGAGHEPFIVVDGGKGDLDSEKNGTITTEWYVNPDDSQDETFLLTATNLSTGEVASTSFTDSVPGASSSATLDLTLTDSSTTQGFINDALFSNDAVGAGTGVIDSFVRISTNADTEEGYNTSGRKLEFDENSSPNFTRDLQLQDIPIIYIDGTAYLEFQLDINEPDTAAARFLSLDTVEIYVSDTAISDPKGTSAYSTFLQDPTSATLVYEMDDLTNKDDEWVALNYSLQSGSGVSDMIMYVPLEKFSGIEADDYVTLYSEFGLQGTVTSDSMTYEWINNSGFEEWAVREFILKSGYKFHDLNANGVWDAGEEGLGGWTIEAYTAGEDGTFGTVDDVKVGEVVTSDDLENLGFYQFSLFDDDTYQFREVQQDGWHQSAPDGDGYITESLKVGDRSLDNNFGNYQFVEISGFKYEDQDGDGTKDGVDLGLGGWKIDLYEDVDGDGVIDAGVDLVIATATTADGSGSDPIGYYEFTGLAPGSYILKEQGQTGWVQTFPTSDDEHELTLTSGASSTGNNFLNFEEIEISGFKYEDQDGDGTKDGVDLGLGGWKIDLYEDVDGDGVIDAGVDLVIATATTADGSGSDPIGYYEFTGLAPGSYILKEQGQTGWVQTFPTSDDEHELTLTSGASSTGNNFLNFEEIEISGFKYEDQDGDGTKDGVDLGLGGWKIDLYEDVDGDGVIDAGVDLVIATATTADGSGSDPIGYYEFTGLAPGSYILKEQGQTGWVQTFPTSDDEHELTLTSGASSTGNNFLNFEEIEISGFKYEDQDGDGTKDGVDLGLGGWKIDLYEDVDGDGVIDAGVDLVIATATTADGSGSDPIGYYEFTGLAPGSYILKEQGQTGWVQTFPTSDDEHELTLTSGASSTGNNFLNFEEIEISGFKYEDQDGDGAKDGVDLGLGGWKIDLYEDVDGDGVIDAGVDLVIATATTADGSGSDPIGYYEFTGLAPGSYILKEQGQTGWVQTFPTSDDEHELTLTSGASSTGNNFLNFEEIEISGFKYEDQDGDGTKDGVDLGLGGWKIDLYEDVDGDGVIDAGVDLVIATATTADGSGSDPIGYYEFTGLAPGSYILKEQGQTGWVQTFPTSDDEHELTLTSGASSTGNNFLNFEEIEISGFKYEDQDGDGTKDGVDLGLGGWKIDLYEDVDGDGVIDAGVDLVIATATTADGSGSDPIGYYEFTGLAPGSYILKEQGQTGWVQTFPTSDDEHELTLTSGASSTGNNFLNFELFDISGYKWEDEDTDGVWDAGESGLSGWTIFIDENNNGVLDGGESSTTTDVNGYYEFTGLDWNYDGATVREVQQTDWVNSFDGSAAIVATSGNDQGGANGVAEDFNFGNWFDCDSFPEITPSHITVYYLPNEPDTNDRDTNDDGYITIKFDELDETIDFDDIKDDIHAFLDNEGVIDGDEEFFGVAYKGGAVPTPPGKEELFHMPDCDDDPDNDDIVINDEVPSDFEIITRGDVDHVFDWSEFEAFIA